MDAAVKMSGITMQFPGVLANDNVNFEVNRGEIHALIGENGAGKTTLMNILYGLYVPTAGEIEILGQKQTFLTAIDAIRAGIGMVHQHFMLMNHLTVADNIVLGEEPRKGNRYLRAEANKRIKALCNEYEMTMDPLALVSGVSLGMQQRIEIMKTLYRKAEIIILDEPTAVLTPQEIDELGRVLQKLKAKGKTIIIITHKLREVIEFSDRITVLRRGKLVAALKTCDTNADEITQMMVGRNVHLGGDKHVVSSGNEVLRIEHLDYHNGLIQKLKDISFEVREGEIFGIAGIDNSGQKELSEAITGIIKADHGRVLLDGMDITNWQTERIRHGGVGFIAQDRQKNGLALGVSVRENMILGYQNLPQYKKHGFLLNEEAITKNAADKIAKYDVRLSGADTAARTLSGGNQQKVVVSREIGHATRLVLADQPSRGVDIGAIELIHKALMDVRNTGQAVLLISLELDEVMLLSDRIGVLHDGKLMGILDAKHATREQIGFLMAGGGIGEEENEN